MKFDIPPEVTRIGGQVKALRDTMHSLQAEQDRLLGEWLKSEACPLQPGDAVEWDAFGLRCRGEVASLNVSFTHDPVAVVVHNNMRSTHSIFVLERVNN